MEYEYKKMLGTLMFTKGNGRFALATLKASDYTFRIAGGDRYDLTNLGSDIWVDHLSPREAVSVVMKCLDIKHNEDKWCDIHETLSIYMATKREYFERRISEL